MAELNVNIGNLPLKNPVMTASGTFGYGIEYADFMETYRENRDVMRFHYHHIAEIGSRLRDLNLPRREYTSNMADQGHQYEYDRKREWVFG